MGGNRKISTARRIHIPFSILITGILMAILSYVAYAQIVELFLHINPETTPEALAIFSNSLIIILITLSIVTAVLSTLARIVLIRYITRGIDKELQFKESLESKIIDRSQNLENDLASRNRELEEKITILNQTERAMLNILEDSKQLEAQLKVERDRDNAIISSMGEGLILTDENANIQLINQAAGVLLRVSPADCYSRKISEIFTLQYNGFGILKIEDLVKKCVREHEIIRFSLMDKAAILLKNADRSVPMALSISPYKSEQLSGSVIIFREVTKDRELEEAKENFISTVSHQLRGPITSIRWFAESLLELMQNAANKQKKYVENIYLGTLHLNEIINLLLDLARVESGKLEKRAENLDIVKIINSCEEELSKSIEKKAVHVKNEFNKNITPFAGNELAVRQVFCNLMANAVKYSHTGGKITVSAFRDDGHITVGIRDEGIGIPRKDQNKIFQKFFRASNAVQLVPDGTGLGLSLVKALIISWSGRVWFETEEGKGTSFYFTIPI